MRPLYKVNFPEGADGDIQLGFTDINIPFVQIFDAYIFPTLPYQYSLNRAPATVRIDRKRGVTPSALPRAVGCPEGNRAALPQTNARRYQFLEF